MMFYMCVNELKSMKENQNDALVLVGKIKRTETKSIIGGMTYTLPIVRQIFLKDRRGNHE